MNEKIQKAIASAKELNGEYVHLTDAIKRLIDAVLECEQPEPELWVPKPGEEVEVFRKGTTEDFVLSGHPGHVMWDRHMNDCVGKTYKVQRIDKHGVTLSCDWTFPLNCLRPAAKKPEPWVSRHATPSEISIAERRERLPPIPPGMVWVVDRTEPPHPEAKSLSITKEWRRRPNPHWPYLSEYEYIKPAEPPADTVSIPVPKAEPFMFTFYADMQEG